MNADPPADRFRPRQIHPVRPPVPVRDAYPQPRRSALSAPGDFIADGPLQRLRFRLFGRRRWPLAVAAGLAAAALLPVLIPVFDRDPVPARPAAGQSAERRDPPAASGPVDPSGTGSVGAARAGRDPFGEAAPGKPSPGREELRAAFEARGFGLSGDTGAVPSLTFPPWATARLALPDAPEPAGPPPEARAPSARASGSAGPETKPPESKAPEPASESGPSRVAAREAEPAPRDFSRLDGLMGRGDQLLTQGEVTAARLFYRRVADEGDPRGARGLARSFDESALKPLPGSPSGNRAEMERWTHKATELEAVLSPRPKREGSGSVASEGRP